MPYTVDVNDPAHPLDSEGAGYGAAELRAIKAKLLAVQAGALIRLNKSQCVLDGPKNATTNVATLLAAGTGLSGVVKGTLGTYTIAFAYGFDTAGNVDFVTQNNTDITISSLPVFTTVYPYADRNISSGAITYGYSQQIPQYVQYGRGRPKAHLLHFNNNLTDEYPNTSWTLNGTGGTYSTTAAFGTHSLSLTTTSYIQCTDAIDLRGQGTWCINFRFRMPTLPSAGNGCILLALGDNAAGPSIMMRMENNLNKLHLWLSSNGTAYDIVGGGAGTKNNYVANQWYSVELVHTGAAYIVRVDGVTDQTIASSVKILPPNTIMSGANFTLSTGAVTQGSAFAFLIDELRVSTVPLHSSDYTPETSEYTADESWPVYRWGERKMYQIGASETAVQRTYLGALTTNATNVTSATAYAYGGMWETTLLPAQNTTTTVTHNIGMPTAAAVQLVCKSADLGFVVGDVISLPVNYQTSAGTVYFWQVHTDADSFLTSRFYVNLFAAVNKQSTALAALNIAKWNVKFTFKRTFE